MITPFPKIAPSHGVIRTPSNIWFLGLIWAHNPNGMSIRSDFFCTDDYRVSLFFTMGCTSPLKKLPLPMGGCWPPSNTLFLEPTRVFNPNGISNASAILHGSLLWQTGQQTDRQTTQLCRQQWAASTYIALQCSLETQTHLSQRFVLQQVQEDNQVETVNPVHLENGRLQKHIWYILHSEEYL